MPSDAGDSISNLRSGRTSKALALLTVPYYDARGFRILTLRPAIERSFRGIGLGLKGALQNAGYAPGDDGILGILGADTAIGAPALPVCRLNCNSLRATGRGSLDRASGIKRVKSVRLITDPYRCLGATAAMYLSGLKIDVPVSQLMSYPR